MDPISQLLVSGGTIFTLVAAIGAVLLFFLPFFVWGVHNQTTRAANELEKLNKKFDQLFSSLKKKPATPKERVKTEQERYEI
ncbi:hypothetical protein [Nitrospina gracilis]|uniref:hypothetical protein n=1 Tax=Nitrospina gracilis TaxID=35801 RepID=UPI001F2585C4|nr:hypothetical protein [Nitrospina gracilis]MCF8721232.1 putative PurR-regulated permease PerM [Nitrospina gracilis Nb-211]